MQKRAAAISTRNVGLTPASPRIVNTTTVSPAANSGGDSAAATRVVAISMVLIALSFLT